MDKKNKHSEKLTGRIEDDPIAQQLPVRPTFIPLRQADIRTALIEQYGLRSAVLESFHELCNRVAAVFHVEHQSTLLRLEEAYELLDPDSQLMTLESFDKTKFDDVGDQLIDQVCLLYTSPSPRD